MNRRALLVATLRAGLVGALLASSAAGQVPRPAPKGSAAPSPTAPKRADEPGPGAASRRGEEKGQPITVDADRMERFGKEGLVVFSGNVVASQDGSTQHADRMEVYLDEHGDRILRTVSVGNVRIVTKDCKMGSAQRAEYLEPQKVVRLIGDARVWDAENVVSGETIDLYLSEDRSVVQGGRQGRVKAQFFPKDDKPDSPKPPKPTAPCPS